MKVAWILGAGGGIGGFTAKRLAATGWTIVVSGRELGPLEAISEQIGGADIQPVDARDADAMKIVSKGILERHGSIDAVVVAVGSILLRPLHGTSPDQVRETIEQNFYTAFNALRATAPLMMRGDGGRVVLFSSVAATYGMSNHAAIAASKAAVEGLARAAAADYAKRGIRVNAIAPALTDTPMAGRLVANEASRDISDNMHPVGRIGDADEVASIAAWLVDGAPDWMTGEVVHVDGGLGRVKAQ
ncbi:MAG TPA: SDR family oxidoreductase [Candidatus Thalassarchaeaceae archaeon]|jgi:NAD(P)-dependent dehydrogenase (short-subunit alcohol dehydrogenase family)|nr:MAG TPA: SDR family oxidoreductase [Candidatus Poseidoniales archaeon]HIH84863.1 SDR family oxidoreductase [Candidatus Thalassarchaeaceae archaeon]|tara:strand:+ start:272 stop:1006 length:735 start_codon:yes stop_codon:yes gene_type:complete